MNWYFEALKKYSQFSGRSRRSEYWYFTLFNIIFQIILMFIGNSMSFPYLDSVYSLAVLIPGIAVSVRRMHDVNKSGWFALIPIYNLILACKDGTVGENNYGRDPKRPEFDEFLQEQPVA